MLQSIVISDQPIKITTANKLDYFLDSAKVVTFKKSTISLLNGGLNETEQCKLNYFQVYEAVNNLKTLSDALNGTVLH